MTPRDLHIDLDERSAESLDAQQQMLRLLAARQGGTETYFFELAAVVRELVGEAMDLVPHDDAQQFVTRFAHALNSSILLTFAAASFIARTEDMTNEDVYAVLERALTELRQDLGDS